MIDIANAVGDQPAPVILCRGSVHVFAVVDVRLLRLAHHCLCGAKSRSIMAAFPIGSDDAIPAEAGP